MGCRKSVACEALGFSLRTVERWEKYPHIPDRRQGPINSPPNKLSELERSRILQMINKKEYGALSPCQIVPKLADKGEYIGSESTIYRLLRESEMLCHRSAARQRVPYRKPASCKAMQPNQVWSWDITFFQSSIRGKFYYLYLIMDIFSRKIVGYRVFEDQTAENAAALAKEAYAYEKIDGKKIKLHSDNGSPMKGSTMLVTLQKLGVVPSFSRPSVSNDNPFSEALFRTLKYCPEYPSKPFESIAQANQWVSSFVRWYNTIHLHSGIKFLTPESRHAGKDRKIIENRKKVYEMARLKNPSRWTGNTRNWEPEPEVLLNPSVLEAKAA
jgi:putative transposase